MNGLVSREAACLLALSAAWASPAWASDAETAEAREHVEGDVVQMPYALPRETLIPGTPGMPGGFHFMVNGFAEAQNAGLGSHRIANAGVSSFDGGKTYPLLTDDWAMGYARDANGWVEGLLMLNFEPLTVFAAGYPELGQSGEGLWDAQHAHQFLHQAVVAFHPLSGLEGWRPRSMMQEGDFDLSLFGGQGSATIGPPIFMHRASNPGPTVPRKHHKGENPHETFPVLGLSLRVHQTWLEASAFSALELTPSDSRFYPHAAAPESLAARVRQGIFGWLELQVSGEHLRNQGHGEPDTYQASASAYAWGNLHGVRLDGLLDWAIDVPDALPGEAHHTAQGLLGEVAARTTSRRDVLWLRSELNQREEPAANGGGVSSPWLFQSLGFEHVVASSGGLQAGLFAEGTVVSIPSSLHAVYGTDVALTLNAGLHLFGMWMLDGDGRPMNHHRM